MLFKAKWLPGGQVELAPMALKGDREVKALMDKDADVTAVFTSVKYLTLCQGLIEAKRVLDNLGPKAAKESWDDFATLEFPGINDLIWDSDKFVEALEATRTRVLRQQLATGNDEDARVKVQEMTRKVGLESKALKENSPDIIADVVSRPLRVLYWRLRASGVKHIISPGGAEVPLPWALRSEDDQAKVIDLLSEVVSREDMEQMDEEARKRFDFEEVKPRTAADIRGKSENTSAPLTSSRPDLPLSSGPTTEPAQR